MSQARGRQEVARQRQRLEALFKKIDGAGLDPELTSHYARYLCVLVSGYAEQSLKELMTQCARSRSSQEIQRFVSTQAARLRNVHRERLRQLVDSFSPEWWRTLEYSRPDELDAFGSVAAVRNNVSHGGDASITIATVRQYFDQISDVLDELCEMFDP